MSKITLALIACCSQKLNQSAPAKEVYSSALFTNSRTYVEQQGWDYYILSAKYGLISPDSIIDSYNQTLKTLSKQERNQWGKTVALQVQDVAPPGAKLVVLAGADYRRFLTYITPDLYDISIPLQGLGIGQQLAWLKTHR